MMQDIWPWMAAKEPLAHAVQDDCPLRDWYSPTEHGAHTPPKPAAKVPNGQGAHDAMPIVEEEVPGWHCEQSL